jgi:hypothetical protein
MTLMALPSCQTIKNFTTCPIIQVEAPQAPTLEPLDWSPVENRYYLDEENFKKYAINLQNLVNYSKQLKAQNNFYTQQIQNCEE